MSRPPNEPDVVWTCRCGARVAIPARLSAAHRPPTCDGGDEHRHRSRKMERGSVIHSEIDKVIDIAIPRQDEVEVGT